MKAEKEEDFRNKSKERVSVSEHRENKRESFEGESFEEVYNKKTGGVRFQRTKENTEKYRKSLRREGEFRKKKGTPFGESRNIKESLISDATVAVIPETP